MRTDANSSDKDYRCIHCGYYVSATTYLSGVANRNHCPYCLRSRHMDHTKPGDRLAACKEKMDPIGLTIKRTAKKYARENQGELMLIHQCTGCGKVSINRIAADDIPQVIYEVFEDSFNLDQQDRKLLESAGIRILSVKESSIVQTRLFGRCTTIRAALREKCLLYDYG